MAGPAGGDDRPRVVVICGPTAVGKTGVGIATARALNGEVLSADSMQVYRGMDIGTAKPTAAERSAVRHHLIDVVDPDEDFDAARFTRLARPLVLALHAAGKVPVIVGGTGLYIKALLRGLFDVGPVDPQVRRRLSAEAEEAGVPALHVRLRDVDPETAARLHPNDRVRILRALEVYESAGRPLSALQQAHRFGDAPFAALQIGLALERAALYERIDRRVDAMASAGLEDEVRNLLASGYGPELKSMQSIGYSHMAAHIAGRSDRAECLRTLKRDTRRFAKRQMTWFRADPGIVWLNPDGFEEIRRLAAAFVAGSDPKPG
jgi:tRNA dimethylallyltransferase